MSWLSCFAGVMHCSTESGDDEHVLFLLAGLGRPALHFKLVGLEQLEQQVHVVPDRAAESLFLGGGGGNIRKSCRTKSLALQNK